MRFSGRCLEVTFRWWITCANFASSEKGKQEVVPGPEWDVQNIPCTNQHPYGKMALAGRGLATEPLHGPYHFSLRVKAEGTESSAKPNGYHLACPGIQYGCCSTYLLALYLWPGNAVDGRTKLWDPAPAWETRGGGELLASGFALAQFQPLQLLGGVTQVWMEDTSFCKSAFPKKRLKGKF